MWAQDPAVAVSRALWWRSLTATCFLYPMREASISILYGIKYKGNL